MVRVFRWWVHRQSKSFPLDAFILYALSNCQNLLACCSKFDHLVDGLLVNGEFPEQLSKKEVQLWIRETKAVNQGNIPTICWKPWSTNAVASKASEFLSAQSNCLELTRWLRKLSLLHWSFFYWMQWLNMSARISAYHQPYPTLWRSRVSVDKFESTGSAKVEKLSIMAVDKRAIAAFGATEHISDTERWTYVFVIIFLNVELITFSLVPAGNDLLQTSKNFNCHCSARFTIIRSPKTRI